MIRYAVTHAELRQRINDIAPTWLDKARERTEAYRVAGNYVKPPSDIWSEIKRAYMDLQGYKCGFCERRLERSEFGNIEHDVEHFRPKGMVEQWPPASAPERANGLNFSLGAASPGLGYFLLPHEPDNYLISCKTCNTAFKSNGFPVEGARELNMESPRHTNERPLLVYPIGSFDDDPQKLIRFEGIVPVPAARSGRRRRRGQTLINFFGLAERDGLLIERSITIVNLHLALALASAGSTDPTRQIAQHMLQVLTSDRAAHANCARSFVALWEADQAGALAFSEAALGHLLSVA
ncbi:MAG: hypothetical protein KY395_06505 [Actinobacteria bacterium]|nr:hypothetical protein [Actinomycetota bacterium]